MATSQPVNNTGGQEASKLGLPEINSLSKRQVLTDAIHYCFKLMLEHGLAVSNISKDASTLAKLIGEELFYRVVKIIYDIKLTTIKIPLEANRKDASSAPFSTKKVLEEAIVETETPSYVPSMSERPSAANSFPVKVMRFAELEPKWSIRTQERNWEEASSAPTQTERVFGETRVKNQLNSPLNWEEALSPPAQTVFDETKIKSGLPAPRIKSGLPAPPNLVAEDTGIIIENGSDIYSPWNWGEASPAKTEFDFDETRDSSEHLSSPSAVSEKSDVNSEDGSRSYSLSEDDYQRPPVPTSIKEIRELNPSWSIRDLHTFSRNLQTGKQLYRRKTQVRTGANKMENFNLITKWVLEHAKEAKEGPVTSKALHDWGVEAARLYSVDGFKASKSWITRIKKKLKEFMQKS